MSVIVNWEGGADMITHEATASMIGYLYQVRYALYHLLCAENPSAQISIEN